MSPYAFRNVLVPVDGSEGSAKALDCALSICAPLGARLTALAVEGRLPVYAASVGEVEEVEARQGRATSGACYERAQRGGARDGVEASPTWCPATPPR